MFLQRYFSHWWIEMPTKKLSIRVTCSATVRGRRQAPRTWYRPNYSYFEPRYTYVCSSRLRACVHSWHINEIAFTMAAYSPPSDVWVEPNLNIINICHLSTLFSNTNHSKENIGPVAPTYMASDESIICWHKYRLTQNFLFLTRSFYVLPGRGGYIVMCHPHKKHSS